MKKSTTVAYGVGHRSLSRQQKATIGEYLGLNQRLNVSAQQPPAYPTSLQYEIILPNLE